MRCHEPAGLLWPLPPPISSLANHLRAISARVPSLIVGLGIRRVNILSSGHAWSIVSRGSCTHDSVARSRFTFATAVLDVPLARISAFTESCSCNTRKVTRVPWTHDSLALRRPPHAQVGGVCLDVGACAGHLFRVAVYVTLCIAVAQNRRTSRHLARPRGPRSSTGNRRPSISKEVKQAQARPAADQAWSGDVYASGCRTPVRTHAKAHTPGKGVRRQARKHPFLCRSTRPEVQPSTRSIAEHFSRHVRCRRRAQRCPEMSTCVQRCPGMCRAHSKDSRVSSCMIR